jgi:hypothetical protein
MVSTFWLELIRLVTQDEPSNDGNVNTPPPGSRRLMEGEGRTAVRGADARSGYADGHCAPADRQWLVAARLLVAASGITATVRRRLSV